MPDTISLLGATTSLLLPWILGSVWVYWLLAGCDRWNVFLVAGHGYLVGVFLTTLTIRLWTFAGLPIHYWSIAAAIAGLTVVGMIGARLRATPIKPAPKSPPLPSWQLVLTALLLALILLRYATLAQELLLRPLFPWDAWMNWAPKAIVWYHHNELVPFVSRGEWLQEPASALNYTEGAGNAWKYPITVPLLQLWGMLGIGTGDHTLIYLPWLFVALAMGLAMYGHLRLSAATIPLATLGCYALLNLPFINVHVALAGYADIWMTAAFGCAVFALHEWGESREWPYAFLALFLAIMCTQLKIPGLIMGGIVLLVFLTSVIRPGKKTGITLLVAVALLIAYLTVIGIDFSISNIGRIAISPDGIVLPYIGRYDLQYHPIHGAMINTLFLMLNWNILWYVFCLAAVALLMKRKNLRPPSLELRALTLTLLFIFFVYYFTSRYKFAQDFTQVNRALIYSIPVMVFYLFNSIRGLRQRA